MDEEVFGPNPEKFDAGRFITKPSLAKDPSFRPFGGGLTYCPGRFMAQKEITTLVVLLFGNLGVTLHDANPKFPTMETRKPCLGMMGPVSGEDLLVKIKRGSPA